VAAKLETILYRGGWPFRLARVFGARARVVTTSYRVPLLPPGAPSLTIAYASDFHAGETTNPALLAAACDALRSAGPDLLLLGGDFVTHDAGAAAPLAAELSRIPAPLGRFAVLGNHDWWADGPGVQRTLEAVGITVLMNRSARLPAPHDQVWICGLDDHWSGRPDASAATGEADGLRVVLMHAPSGLLDLGDERFELALCGHTHGGQLALPGGIPVIVPHGELSRRYARGRFDLGRGRTMLVSVGLGCVVLPLRLFAPSEIVVCQLVASDGVATHEVVP
jgi:predicted MPP superfamily phosphohydrolase